jgi:isopenicillin-N N-acyltransferase-like protein
MGSIPLLTAAGDAHACGLAHGRRFAREIAENLSAYLSCFAACGLNADEAMMEAERWWDAICTRAPDYADEMRGIAVGAEQSEAAIALLNARYELAFTLFGNEARRQELVAGAVDGCTTFGLLPPVTSDRHTWLGQNWDWLESIHGRTFVLRMQPKDRPSFVCLTEAGIAGGKMGVNECGIGLVENGLASSHDGIHPYRRPFHVRCRQVVQSETLDQAMLAISDMPRTCSANFLVGKSGSCIVNMETSPQHVSSLYPRDGIITHSNHFLTAGHGDSLLEKVSPNTLYRADRIRELLESVGDSISLAHMRCCTADHFGAPYAICRHPDPMLPASKRTMTVGAVLIDLDARVMHVANGPPCTHAYVAFSV